MIVTLTIIIQALDLRFRHYFDPAIQNGTLDDLFKKIAADICGTPVMRPAKWLSFTKTGESPSGKTNVYQVRSKENPHMLLGEVRWYSAFRCYSFFTETKIILEPQCMADIMLFIEALMFVHPKNKPNAS